jgi:hypothetical protein
MDIHLLYNMYLSRFDSLMNLSYNHGNQYLSDCDFIDQGFCADIDAYGNEKIRDATISEEINIVQNVSPALQGLLPKQNGWKRLITSCEPLKTKYKYWQNKLFL